MSQGPLIELPAEWGGVVPSQAFIDECRRIVDEANKRGVVLRAMGGVGIRLHCLGYGEFASRMDRIAEGKQEFSDLDFMSYKKQRDQMKDFFTSMGYSKRRATLATAASERQIYFHQKGWFFVDVFFDRLVVANHQIDFRGRLELDSPTVPVTDLLLEKLQIVGFSEKDLKDTLLLLIAHDAKAGNESEAVNVDRVANLLSDDWGFWYTVTTNLKGIKTLLPTIPDLSEDERSNLLSKIDSLEARIDAEPKTTGWKLRSTIGSRKRWYHQVETTETVGEFGIWRLREEPTRTRQKAEKGN